MLQTRPENRLVLMLSVAIAGWVVPGAGYFMLAEYKRAAIILASIVLTFFLGIWAGSIGVIDPFGDRLWYIAQMMTSPLVALIGSQTEAGAYEVFSKPNEIGQIYTSVAGMLNLLVVVNSVYLAHIRCLEGGRR